MDKFQQLISCDDLARILHNERLIVLDASIPPIGNMQAPEYSWPNTAILNARRFCLTEHFSDLDSHLPHTMPTASAFEKAVRALGINADSQIVIYDDLGLFSAARAWFMFKAMGHNNVAVLDGGLPQWLKQQKQVVQALEPDQIITGNFVAKASERHFCDWQYVQEQTQLETELIIDARAERRFLGLDPEPRPGMRGGHMPNAVNLPYTELLSQGLFKPTSELSAIFKQLNPDNKVMIMTCGSGVTACILALAAELLNYEGIYVYDGSWSEWGANSSLAVVK